jgi:hypothetical protein
VPADEGVIIEQVGSFGGAITAIAVQDDIAYVGEGTGLTILDVQDSFNPTFLARLPLPGVVKDIQVAGDYAYVTVEYACLLILNVQNPAYPTLLGSYDTERYAIRNVYVAGNTAYVANGWGGLLILDVSDPTNPTLLGSYDTAGGAETVQVVGSTAYVANGWGGLLILDMSDPASPAFLGSYDTEGETLAIHVVGSTAYLAAGDAGLLILDVSDPISPTLLGSYYTPWKARDVQVVGSTAYIAAGAAYLYILDVSDPFMLIGIGIYDTPGDVRGIQVVGNTAYVADEYAGLHILDVSPANPTLLGSYDTAGGGTAIHIQVVSNTAYIAADAAGLHILDVRYPANPMLLGSYDIVEGASFIHVVGSTAYVAAGEDGLLILDVSDPANPTLLGSYDTGFARDVQVVGSTAYVADGYAGLSILDVSNPTIPTLLGSYDTGSNAKALQVLGSIAFVANDNRAGLSILDVSDPSNPTLLSGYNDLDLDNPTNPTLLGIYDNTAVTANAIQVMNSIAYVANDNRAGLFILDVRNPTNPTLLGSYHTAGYAEGVHVVDSTAYVADGRAGLVILDVSDPAAPMLLGSYDIAGDARDIQVVGNTIYVAAYDAGVQILRVTFPAPLSSVTIAGPTTAIISETYSFNATITPASAARPVEYVWSPEPLSGQGTAIATYRWQQTGSQQITVTVSNASGSVSAQHMLETILIAEGGEPNDTCAQANIILSDGTIQQQSFYQEGDIDWFAFNATANTTYLVEAQVPAESRADVALEVYGDCAGDPDASQDYTFAPGVRLQFEAPADGPLWLKLRNHDPQVAGDNVTYNLSVRELGTSATPGALIIVAGRLKTSDPMQANIHQVTRQVRETFIPYGYTDEHITLLATDETLAGWDAMPTRATLKTAITEWAIERVGSERALTFYLVDHGDKDTFYLDAPNSEELTPQQLNDWLDVVRQQRPDTRINVIIDTCYAGSFIDPQQTISTSGTVVIASTAADKLAWASQQGAVFSDYFLGGVRQGRSLYDSFTEARWAIQDGGYPQEPWLDDNGNGLHNDFTDGQEAQRRGFAYAGTLDDGSTLPDLDEWQPYIQQVEPVAVVHQEGIIRAKVVDNQQIDKVWAIVYKPSYRPPDSQSGMVSEELLPSPRLRKSSQSDVYEGLYDGFTETGTYTISVYAEDNRGLKARPVTMAVEVNQSTPTPTPTNPPPLSPTNTPTTSPSPPVRQVFLPLVQRN